EKLLAEMPEWKFNRFVAELKGIGVEAADLIRAEWLQPWEKLFSKLAWRSNPGYLTKVSRYIENGLDIVVEGGELIVKQADGVTLGKLDIDQLEEIADNALKVRAEVNPGRLFDPDQAGGAIVKKSWDNPTITTQGISNIETHVARFGPSTANDEMISRLNKIKNGEIPITDYDKRFYTHELEEYARYQNMGYPTGVPSNADDAAKLWNDTHTASLESYGVHEVDQPLYHPNAQ
ncbi:MAG TPA: hypothetical protein PKB07_26080, partial [Flavilitoribacter sp.]|nr:hypothetical protein [Flavilitoribacter sp.]